MSRDLTCSMCDVILVSLQVLDSDITGRKKIEVIQLQGHLFFGNITLFGETVKKIIQSNPAGQLPFIVSSSNDLIRDCTPPRNFFNLFCSRFCRCQR